MLALPSYCIASMDLCISLFFICSSALAFTFKKHGMGFVGCWSLLLLPLEGRLSREGAFNFKLREHYPHISYSPEMLAVVLTDVLCSPPDLTFFKLEGGAETLMHQSKAGRAPA